MDSLKLTSGDHLGVAESVNPTDKQLMFYSTSECASSRRVTKSKSVGVVRYPAEGFKSVIAPMPGRRCVPKVVAQDDHSVTITVSGVTWETRKKAE